MPASTARNLIPYPVPTDPVANTDDIVKTLAERVDIIHGRMGLSPNVNIAAANGSGFVDIVFPTTFGGPIPYVFLQMVSAPAGFTWETSFASLVTTTGFRLNVKANVAGNYTYSWSVRF